MIIQLKDKIDCRNICSLIQKMLNSYGKSNSMENKAISIKIIDIVENLPKLEYKDDEDNCKE